MNEIIVTIYVDKLKLGMNIDFNDKILWNMISEFEPDPNNPSYCLPLVNSTAEKKNGHHKNSS